MPEQCYRNGLGGRYAIPRIEANALEGDAAFRLRKGSGKSYEADFGYNCLSLCPERRLRQEVGEFKARIPWLLDILETGIPPAWLDHTAGMRVGKYAFAAFNSTAARPLPEVSRQPETGNK